MATIEDVAKLAGLSRTTVSRVINDQPYVTDEKRQRIMQAMNDLGYVPNSSARRLRSQRTDTIAVILPRITNPFFGHLIESMEEKASEWGYQIIVCQTHDSKKKELDYLQLLRTKQVDGVIMTSKVNDWETIEPYLESGPVILCNEYMESASVPMVHMNHRKAAYEATLHLIEEDCSNIAYVCGGAESHLTRERWRGFKDALSMTASSSKEQVIIDWGIDVKDGQEIFHYLKENHPEVDGVFTGSDEVAAGIIYEAGQSEWRIPEDLAVVGFDNQMISMLMVPPVTTIEQPVKEMAAKTIEIMVQELHHPGVRSSQTYIFDHHLLLRDSTKRKQLSVQ
ncbi:LacI family DNA-binding transcriptional regulator [Halobacillus yeomjeoni]|uniref:LacI family DNA-binding transcriptional regulator n=1 Tax=Halobacillus yeomjeoni TaxID=311194 RepID=A0A931HSB6_9BACI|nr:LacI family DNA-binding transcriptional regulator [Halobacillus yeomjeoni]MBH0228729.1 LacI family DNA-binding transcriptional regulator [Halobacillus yeomjeoni]